VIRPAVALGLCLLGVAAPAALAQSPSQTGYGETPLLPQIHVKAAITGSSDMTPAAQPSAAVAGAVEASQVAAQPRVAVAGAVDSGGPVANALVAPVDPVQANGHSLPFTGLDLGLVALVAVLLLAAGVGLRRATAPRSTS
jgi:hypothetical protein